MNNEEYDLIVKIVLLGTSTVGKSNLLLRYSKDMFEKNFRPTIGMDFISKNITLNQYKVKA